MDKTAHVTKKAIALIKALHNPPVGAREFNGGWSRERVDAILFNSTSSFMIEIKISHADFLADAKKDFRANPERGVGSYRYYACPAGLICPGELPERWGLIYVDCEDTRARASMPVGFGGFIRNPKKDTKHERGWTVEGYDEFGSGPGSVSQYRFDVNHAIERQYIFALAARYKSGKFMDNIL